MAQSLIVYVMYAQGDPSCMGFPKSLADNVNLLGVRKTALSDHCKLLLPFLEGQMAG